VAVADGKTITAVQRANAVLLLFTDAGRATLGVTEIANSLGLSKAVVHRILASLKEDGFIAVDQETRRYSLGPAALALGLAYLDNLDVRSLARPSLERLCELTDETATLSIRHGATRVYIDQVTPPREVKMTVPLGQPFPLHAGGSSKAFLAFLPDDEQEQYLSSHRLDAMTDATITDVDELRTELSVIRKRGFSRSLGERQAGAASVAAPVFNHEGNPVAVISVCGPLERFRAEADDAAKHLLDHTRELSRRLGFR
jgi:DNA-binding IclR family transcriptional regulator